MGLAPIWITDAGSLGVVPEGKFYKIALEAEDPEAGPITYSLIAGSLPAGVQVDVDGIIAGIPVSIAETRGVPSEVSENTTSKFAIRATDEEGRIADRTFTLTVSGQDKPEWITPEGRIGTWIDASEINFQFEYEDLDPGDELTVSLVAGTLPEGLSISSTGLLSGFAEPLVNLGVTGIPGFDVDGTTFDEFPFDFRIQSINQNHQFTLKLTDGKDVVLRTFEIFILTRNAMTADNTELTADIGHVTADSIAVRSPYITNNVDDLGRFRHDNYFAHQFLGEDPDGDAIGYRIDGSIDASTADYTADTTNVTTDVSSLPLGLYLDPATGWLSGYLPDIGFEERTYTFSVKAFKIIEPTIASIQYTTSLTVYGDIDTEVTWLTDSDLGTIDNGEISTLYVEAQHIDKELFYRFPAGGPYSKLPQGLQLMPSGNIIGQVSFKTFSLDGGSTTFDSDFETRLDADPTTFDLTFNFIVEAYSLDSIVSVTREFTILVNREYDNPYSTLYCKAMPPLNDRLLLDTLLTNDTVIPEDIIYRPDDPYHGVADNVIYQHAFGLNPVSLEKYVEALEQNHYNKNLILGEIKTARALDENENVIYEVVYSQIIDTFVNAQGESAPATVPIKYPAIDDGQLVNEVHPNSLANMNAQVVDTVGQTSKILPIWMLSKQEDGTVPGFTPAWVIAYTKPGQSKLLQYNITEFFGTKFNLINFEIDRYTIDAGLLRYWGITADSTDITADSDILVSDSDRWEPGYMTTFDRFAVDYAGSEGIFAGDEDVLAGDATYSEGGAGTETIFDGGSTRFEAPVDMYDDTDTLDKYIKFPKTTIINNVQYE